MTTVKITNTDEGTLVEHVGGKNDNDNENDNENDEGRDEDELS